jgi:hypothetical protein
MHAVQSSRLVPLSLRSDSAPSRRASRRCCTLQVSCVRVIVGARTDARARCATERMLDTARIMQIPVVVTEQYPQGAQWTGERRWKLARLIDERRTRSDCA